MNAGSKILAIVAALLMPAALCYAGTAAQGAAGTQPAQKHIIYFRWDKYSIDRNYLDNAENLDNILDHLKRNPAVDSIAIYAYASPEGKFAHNRKLSRRRAEAAKSFILRNRPKNSNITDSKFILHPMNENWSGLLEAVENSYHRFDRDKVLAILRDTAITDATREWRLQHLNGGRTWKVLMRNYMPRLRYAAWICIYGPERQALVPLDKLEELRDTIRTAPDSTTIERGEHGPVVRQVLFNLKTNLAYDALTAVNYAVEVPLGERFSVQFEHICPWWKGGPYGNKYCLQMNTFCGEFRWWFAPDGHNWFGHGHYVGAYADGGKYDIQIADRFGLSQNRYWGTGLSYGYSIPLCSWANLEFSVSLGYKHIDFQKYTPTPDWSLLVKDPEGAGIKHYFGPTKAKVSLTVPIAIKKGGKSR